MMCAHSIRTYKWICSIVTDETIATAENITNTAEIYNRLD